MKNVGNNSRGRNQGVPKIFRAPMYMAHCAVIFATAQLSCMFSPIFCFIDLTLPCTRNSTAAILLFKFGHVGGTYFITARQWRRQVSERRGVGTWVWGPQYRQIFQKINVEIAYISAGPSRGGRGSFPGPRDVWGPRRRSKY